MHGSIDSKNVKHLNVVLDFLGIQHKELDRQSAGRRGVVKHEGIVAAFPSSSILCSLDSRLCGGLVSFHHNLIRHMLKGGVRDNVRICDRVDPNLPAFVNERLRFGFGRVQPATNKKNWQLHGEKMPTLDVSPFKALPTSMQSQLMTIIEHSQVFLLKQYPNAFPNKMRNDHCATQLNAVMGFPRSKALFEYYDIVISRNAVLTKHIDTKNDHREGYDHCVVYSFYATVDNLEYKVSIIMCTRCTVGCPIDRIK